MNILVTGGLSHLGTNFINLYSNKFKQLVFIDKISYCSNNNTDIINSNNIISIYGDINNLDIDFILNFYKIDIILHCAASTHVDRSYTHFNEFIDNNIKATIKLLDSAKIYPYLKKIIHISTDEVYGGNNNKIVTEEDKFNPTNPYSGSKAAIENIINSYIYTYKLPIIIIRPNNIFGKYQYKEKAIPKFIYLLLNNKPVTIHGNGNHIRDYLFVEDLCNALYFIIENIDFDFKNHIFNIGVDNPININELVLFIYKYLKLKNLTTLNEYNYFIYTKNRPYNDERYQLDCSKINNFGFVIKNEWEKNIIQTINWYISKYTNKYSLY
jgi:dTDP-glucose 4,6-dehydratase